MTFIFNVGGYQPQREHCLMMRGKLADWSKEDIMQFAEQNGIRNAEKIIGQVACLRYALKTGRRNTTL